MMLDVEDMDGSVLLIITGSVSSAEKWTTGLFVHRNLVFGSGAMATLAVAMLTMAETSPDKMVSSS